MKVPAKHHIMDEPPAAQLSRAVIYTRYSSHAQRDVSIEQQLKACKVFAERQGIEVVGTYEDRALTGTSDRRPGFQKMIRDAERGDWDYVIVYTLDRFARDRYDSAVYKRQLKTCGVKVLSAMENISDDPTGVLMESLLEGLAEYYSKELSRKITRGMDDNASKCMVNGLLPLGYIRDEKGQYAIDETEAELVREIYRRVDEGELQSRIIADLNLRGLRTKLKKPWTRSSFDRILCNERYTGVYIYKDIRIPGGIPQIIDQELFDAVQHRLHTKNNPRSTSPQRRRRDASIYLLTGKLYCGHCKSPMIGVSGKSQAATPYYYYVCKEKRSNHTCDKKPVRREKIEYSIAAALKNTMLTDQAITALADAAIAHQHKNAEHSDIAFLRDRLAEINTAIKNIVSAIEAGIFSSATQKRLADLESEQATVTHQLAAAERDAANALTKDDIVAALKTFQNGDLNDKDYQETLIDTFLIAAYLYDDEMKIVFNLGGKQQDTTLPFDIDDIPLTESENVSITSAPVHQIVLYEPFYSVIAQIGELFVFSQSL